MILHSDLTIRVGDGQMPAYLARPAEGGRFPAVIVLEGVYGFDDELRRITDLLASLGYVGLAINYFHRTHPTLNLPFTAEGRTRGEAAATSVKKSEACSDVAAARDWLNLQPFVEGGHIGTWGFGLGGTIAFVAATLPGVNAAVAFYGQSIASLMPSGEAAPLEDAHDVRAPLLLVFGGHDELISQRDVELTTSTLQSYGKLCEVQAYPNVGHSFFRTTGNTTSTREAADAWDRVRSFFGRHLS